MTISYGLAARNARLASVTSSIARILLYSGSPPPIGNAATGSLLARFSGVTFGVPSGASASLINTPYSATSLGVGVIGYFRMTDASETTSIVQGTAGDVQQIATANVTVPLGSSVLSFNSTAGISVGMAISGPGVPSDTYVIAVSPTAVTLSSVLISNVGAGVVMTFSHDMTVMGATVTLGQNLLISDYTLSEPNA